MKQNLRVDSDGRGEIVDLTVRSVAELSESLLLVVFEGRAVPPQPGQGSGRLPQPSYGADEMEEELRETRARLQATIEEFEAANEELQSTNEELQSANEELQTSKEEALSINEELNTVSAELKGKVEEIDKAHADLRNLFRSTGIGTLFLDRKRRIRRFTPPMAKLFRIRESDAGRPIEDITPRFSNVDLGERIERVLETLEPSEVEVQVRGEGAEQASWYTLWISPYRTMNDRIDGVVLTFTDVTGMKESEGALRVERNYAKSIIETVFEPFVVLDPDLRVLSANQSFYEVFGATPETAVGERLYELGKWGEGSREVIRRLGRILPRNEAVEELEMELDLVGLGSRLVRIKARPVRMEGGSTDRILVSARDVTEKRRREREKEEEARQKDWFLAMLGHELRNPLAPIRGSLTMLREGDLSEEASERLLDIADRQARHLTRLVGDLLDISRITEGKLARRREPVDLVRLVQDTVEDQRAGLEEARLEIALELPEEAIWLEGDADRLRQAFGNLLDNARKFTPEDGRIWVRVSAPSDETAEAVVEDSGMGMGSEVLEKVFEPFTQVSDGPEVPGQGLGVGLTLVRTLIEAHGGTVRAESDGSGHGSRFIVNLPRRKLGAGPSAPPAPAAPAGSHSPRRVLVVEDQTDAAEITRQILEMAGHTAQVAGDGEAALAAVAEFRPDVVLCDLGLPGTMSGHDVASAVRANPEWASIRLVAHTGYGQETDRLRAKAAGFDALLTKPVSPEELRGAVAEAVAAPRPSSASDPVGE